MVHHQISFVIHQFIQSKLRIVIKVQPDRISNINLVKYTTKMCMKHEWPYLYTVTHGNQPTLVVLCSSINLDVQIRRESRIQDDFSAQSLITRRIPKEGHGNPTSNARPDQIDGESDAQCRCCRRRQRRSEAKILGPPVIDVEQSSLLACVKLLDAVDASKFAAGEVPVLDVWSGAIPSTIRIVFPPTLMPAGTVESGSNVLKDVGIKESSSDDLLAPAVVCRAAVVCRVSVVCRVAVVCRVVVVEDV